MNLQVEIEVSRVIHNRVLLGHLGMNLHLVQLLAAEEHDNLRQPVDIMEVQPLYAMVVTGKTIYSITNLSLNSVITQTLSIWLVRISF